MKKKIVSILLTVCLCGSLLAGCSKETENDNPKPDRGGKAETEITGAVMELPDESNVSEEELIKGYYNFAGNILADNVSDEENVMISPASIMYALDMAAMGAEGDTFSQIANLLCDDATKLDLNSFAEETIESFIEDGTVSIADSLWLNSDKLEELDITVNEEYVNLLKESYLATVKELAFDNSAIDEINDWVNDNTNEMIPKIIDEIGEDAFLYLINAIAFEGTWNDEYEDYQIDEEGTFVNSIGHEEIAKMLYSTEGVYLENDLATGFLKYYEGEQYAFMAILPKDMDTGIADFASEFDGDALYEFYNSASYEDVYTMIPAFTFDYDVELSNTLMKLGMEAPFRAGDADFSVIGSGDDVDFWISRVIHKTHIELDEKGTRAVAATAIEMNATCSIDFNEPKKVYLDRPFEFAIIDTNTGLPLFLGTVNTVGEDTGVEAYQTHPAQINVPEGAERIVLVERYTNWAWGYCDSGYFYDSLGNVYEFDMLDYIESGSYDYVEQDDALIYFYELMLENGPLDFLIDPEILSQVDAEMQNVDPLAEFVTEHSAFDAGQESIFYITEDNQWIELYTQGDYDGYLDDEAAINALNLLGIEVEK